MQLHRLWSPRPVASKLETQENQWYTARSVQRAWDLKSRNINSRWSLRPRQETSMPTGDSWVERIFFYSVFYSSQVFSTLNVAHPHWGEPSAWLSLLLQMLSSCRNTLQTHPEMFNWQQLWHMYSFPIVCSEKYKCKVILLDNCHSFEFMHAAKTKELYPG